MDSADFYAARKEAEIDSYKKQLGVDRSYQEKFTVLYEVADRYANYTLDSSLVYLEKAAQVANENGDTSLRITADIRRSVMLTVGGFYLEAAEILKSLNRKELNRNQLVEYYNSYTSLYHEVYSSPYEPTSHRESYRERYTTYRDTLLSVLDTTSLIYLRNMEKKEARCGNFAEARRYNSIRLNSIKDHKSYAYATCLYDRFVIAYHYEGVLTGDAVDDLLEAAIIEVEYCNRDIYSLLRVITLLNDIGEVEDAKKISDYYYASLSQFGSRKRLLECGEKAMSINEQNYVLLQKTNNEFKAAIVFISILAITLLLALLKINSSRIKISLLKDNLQQSGKISKGYVGVVFKLYSSYIRRLDAFRTKVYSTLKKGQIDQALELTSPSKDLISEERRDLFRNFDTAFVDIFPNYIQTVNSYLKPELQIIPKRTEVLNNELRILALIKLGIDDNEEIAEMLHCSVKTVYNLRAIFKSRLAVPEDRFYRMISEL